MERLRLDLFGGFELSHGDRLLAVSARKARALLAYLAMHQGRPQRRDKVASLLWGESGVTQARTSLRQALTGIRRALPDACSDAIVADTEAVSLAAGSIDVDVPSFLRAAVGEDPAALEQAIDLYRGDLLEGLHFDAPEFEAWLTAERHRLRELALRAMTTLAEHDLSSGDYDRGTRTLTRLLTLDPLRESAHRALMRLFMRQNRPALALKQYRALRDLLRRELAVAPEPETTQLYQQVLSARQQPVDVPEEAPDDIPAPAMLSASVADADGAPAAPPEPPATADVEASPQLRQASILFADLSGYTQMTVHLDPEEVQAILAAYFDRLQHIVSRFGGRIDKLIGDGVLAVFGIPVAHSNDPERAVRAALAIHEAMPDLSESLGRPLEVHVGIASGQVLSGIGGALTGEAVNLAARLTELAASGQTLVSEDVQLALSSKLVGDSLGDLAIRGLSQTVRAWLVRDLAAGDGTGLPSPFVGRRAEARQFERIMDACTENGEGMTIVVRGEAGIGKTRLVGEMVERGRQSGFSCSTGLILDFGSMGGQQAVRAVMRALVAGVDADDETLRSAAAKLVADGIVTNQNRTFLYALTDLAQPADLKGIFDAMEHSERLRGLREVIGHVTRYAARQTPLMMAFEDVHWANDRTLEQLATLAAVSIDSPVILVLTTRAEDDPLNRAWRDAAGQPPLMTMDLGPLRPEDAHAFAVSVAGVNASGVDGAIERAAGNPLFLEQLLLSDSQAGDDVPGTVNSIVLSRMDALPPRDRRGLQAASVMGQRFTMTALRYLLDDATYDPENLMTHAFIRTEGEGFLFSHALVRDAVYASLVRSQRRQLHRRAADCFADSDKSVQAEHLERAEDPAAATAYLEATTDLAQRRRVERAVACAERGAALADDTGQRFQLQMMRGNLLRDLGKIETSISAFRAALDDAASERDKARSWIGMAKGYRLSDRYGDAIAALDHAEESLRPDVDADKLAQVNVLRGNVYFPQGRLDPCMEAHSRALDLARRTGAPLSEARALSGLADAYYLKGAMQTARSYFERCVAIAQANNFVRVEIGNRPMLALINALMLDFAAATEHYRASLDIAQRVGNLRALLLINDVAAFLFLCVGDWAQLCRAAHLGIDIARRIGSRRFEGELLAYLAIGEWHQNNNAAAVAAAEEACAVSRETGMEFAGASALGVFALVGGGHDDDERRRALAEGEGVLAAGAVSHSHLEFYYAAIETTLNSGDWDEARRYADALAGYTAEEPLPWSDFVVARARALADWEEGVRSPQLAAELSRLHAVAGETGLQSLALPDADLSQSA